MRTLFIVRHAKSSWADVGMRDHDRPLNERGLRDAPMMAARFVARNERVDALLCSPAKRTVATARVFAQALGLPAPQEMKLLYLASVDDLLSVVNALPAEVHSALIVGHNPGVSLLVDDLTGSGIGDMTTCAMVRIDLQADTWEEVMAGTGEVVWSDSPKVD